MYWSCEQRAQKVSFKYIVHWNILHKHFYNNYSTNDNNYQVHGIDKFQSIIIIGAEWYDYPCFMIIAQP